MIALKIKPSLWLGSFSFGNKSSQFLVSAVTFLGLALRLVRLDFQPLWWDEGWSLFFATRAFGTMLQRTAVDIHPPLYYALLTIWIQLAGKGEVALRLLSVLVGVASIPLLYAMAKRLFDSRVALVSAFLLAIAPLHVYYSQEVRMYGLVTTLSLASVYLFVELQCSSSRDRRPLRLKWLLYIVASAAALYTQYYAAFVIAFQVIVVAFIAAAALRKGQPWRPVTAWIAAWLAVAALYLPWALYAGPKLYAYVTMKVVYDADVPLDPLTYLVQHLVAFSVGHVTDWTWLAPLSLAALLLLSVGVLFQRGGLASRGLVAPRMIAFLYLVVPLVLGYFVNLIYPFTPVHAERLLLPAAPAFFMLIASGILVLWERRKVVGLSTLVLVTGICAASLYDFYTVPRDTNDDYRPLIANIQRLAQPGDLLLAVHPWQIGYLEAYYDGAPLTVVETPSAAWIRDSGQLDRELGALLADRQRVWLPALQTLGAVLENALDGYLRPRTFTVLDTWYGTTRLEFFAAAKEPPSANRPITLGQNLSLADYAVTAEPVAAGQDILPIEITWRDPVPAGFNESFRLVDTQGYAWAQDDRGIEKGKQRIGFAVPLGTPPGEYDLNLIVYRESNNAQEAVRLAKVRVTTPHAPNVAGLPHRLAMPLADLVNLVGYDKVETPLQPGVATNITFYWQAQRQLNVDYHLTLEAADDKGNVFARSESPPARGIYPMTRWQSGEIIRDPQSLTLRADTPDGDLHLLLSLKDASGRSVATARIARAIRVKGRPHYFGAPSPSVKSYVRFSDVALLAGYDMIQEKGKVHLILYWQALSSTATSFKVFAHVMDDGGNLVNQVDQVPGAGAFPTTGWVKGEYLVDDYYIPLSSAQAAEIIVGMYDPPSGARLPAFDLSNEPLGDHIVLAMQIN